MPAGCHSIPARLASWVGPGIKRKIVDDACIM